MLEQGTHKGSKLDLNNCRHIKLLYIVYKEFKMILTNWIENQPREKGFRNGYRQMTISK